MAEREVFLVGSVPLKPASSVFDCVCEHKLVPMMKRIPDGEQAGWNNPMFRFEGNPALETSEPMKITTRPTSFFDKFDFKLYRLKPGRSLDELDPTGMDIADSAVESYEEFKKYKEAGKFSADTRFCVTLCGPGTSFGCVDMPLHEMLPAVLKTFNNAIKAVLDRIPADELTIQLDLAGEVELEELRRRPEAFDLPIMEKTESNWPMADSIDLIAEISNAIPIDVELGFHLCALWHIDQSQGQDLNVHVDWCNELSRKITRPIGYLHIPTTLDYAEKDFAPLSRLELQPGTRLFIGLVHAEDGAEGAERRACAASVHYPDFGVAAFCGLAQPSRDEYMKPHSVEEIMDMHYAAAQTSTQ